MIFGTHAAKQQAGYAQRESSILGRPFSKITQRLHTSQPDTSMQDHKNHSPCVQADVQIRKTFVKKPIRREHPNVYTIYL